jgi:hypothetical protein
LVLLSSLLLALGAVTAAPSAAQTPSAEGQTFTFPWPPDWVARGKYQKMILRGVTGYNPGQWDVHACGTLPDCPRELRRSPRQPLTRRAAWLCRVYRRM